ncbi:PepSY domain-containing protein [Nioella nitratireducens]|uniref:PepSY domain-containing protein n=1 Tax=Nioella nitratireducens TaxID=1287720 RepID=UPI0008FD343B|nr:PepSY domain-containing protein [Nioella nitratireducens]
MTRTALILPSLVLVGLAPLAAAAETMDSAETQMFQAANLSLQQAGDTALSAHAGSLAAVTFGDVDGRAVYEATVLGDDGTPWTVMVDASTGEVLASGSHDMMKADPVEDRSGDGEADDDGAQDDDGGDHGDGDGEIAD